MREESAVVLLLLSRAKVVVCSSRLVRICRTPDMAELAHFFGSFPWRVDFHSGARLLLARKISRIGTNSRMVDQKARTTWNERSPGVTSLSYCLATMCSTFQGSFHN